MLEVVIWDVQHGSAAYIKTPNKKHIVIDLGTGTFSDDNLIFSPLLHLRNKYRVDSLDMVIITHPHTDHLDDIFNFDALSPRVLYRPVHLTEDDIRKGNPSSDSEIIDKYLEINQRYSAPIEDENDPCLPDNNGGVSISSFTPSNCSRSNINNHSIVTIIEYLGLKVTIPGDNENASWDELLENRNFINAITGTNIFIASHHGRESGFCPDLFEYFTPYLNIISDDKVTATSVTSKYTERAEGWNVHSRSGKETEKRYCLTTRQDGVIVIKVWEENGSKYLNVEIK